MLTPIPTFDHAPVTRHELQAIEEDGKRFYLVAEETDDPFHPIIHEYKSVTTIIGEKSDKTWLKEWRDRVGEAEADTILARAQVRGTAIHDMAEKFLKNDLEYTKGHGTINVMDFLRVVPLLQKKVSHIYGQELPLFSHKLKTAGKADLVCWWDGEPAIVDFKTSRNIKLKGQIENYCIQTACYAKMFTERYNIHIDNIVIILMVDHEDKPVVFEDFVFPSWNKKVLEYFGDE